jgi:hypothetical protein
LNGWTPMVFLYILWPLKEPYHPTPKFPPPINPHIYRNSVTIHSSALKAEAAHTTEMSVTLATSTWYDHPKTESTYWVNSHEGHQWYGKWNPATVRLLRSRQKNKTSPHIFQTSNIYTHTQLTLHKIMSISQWLPKCGAYCLYDKLY